MPVRHRTNFTKKCPTDLEGRLRKPSCRVKQPEFNPHNNPTPKPPGPPSGPTIPTHIIPPPPPVFPSGGGNSFPTGLAIAGGVIGGAALGVGAGILARRALQSAYRASGGGEDTIEMTDIDYQDGAEGEPPIIDEPIPAEPAAPAEPPIDLEPTPAAGDAGEAVLELAQNSGDVAEGGTELTSVGADAATGFVEVPLDSAATADVAGSGFAAGITSFGRSAAQLSSNAVKLGARALNALKPTVAPPAGYEAVPQPAGGAQDLDAEFDPPDLMEQEGFLDDLISESLGQSADAGTTTISAGIEAAEATTGAAEAGTELMAASGADAVAAASAAEIASEGAAAGTAAVAAETTAAITTSVAEAEALAAPFDVETLGAAAGVAAASGTAAGSALGAAAAAGVLATVIPAFVSSHHQGASATLLSSSEAQKSLQVLKISALTNPKLKSVLAMAKLAISQGRPLYSVYDGKSTSLVSQLSVGKLAQAAANYNVNPNIFKGVSPVTLQAMGLNPALSKGVLPTTNADKNIDNIKSVAELQFKTTTPTRQQLNTVAKQFFGGAITSVFDSSVSRVPTTKFINTIKPVVKPPPPPPATTGTTAPLTAQQTAVKNAVGGIENIVNDLIGTPATPATPAPAPVQTPQQAATQSVVGGISNIVNAIQSAPATTPLPTTGTTAPALTQTSAPNPSLSTSDQAILNIYNSAK